MKLFKRKITYVAWDAYKSHIDVLDIHNFQQRVRRQNLKNE
jgi:hypothetical protein